MQTPSESSTIPEQKLASSQGIEKLLAVVAQLRHPTQGCPWDLKQTHASLKPYLLEESYECLEAIDSGNMAHLKEELGDVLLQVALHAQIAQDNQKFTFEDVCNTLSDKLIRRHPHVFANVHADTPEQVVQNWEQIKQAEKGDSVKPVSILDGVSQSQPALSRALETSKRAVKVGFEWPNLESLWACVMSEYDELHTAHQQGASADKLEDEMGDIFFASVNLARHFKIDPEVALTRATNKFVRRFQRMEQLATQPLDTLDFDTWDALWKEAKAQVG